VDPATRAWRGLDEASLTRRGRALGAVLRAGDVVLLDGPMGAGKTTMVRAIALGLGVIRPERVQSPTFTLCMIHRGPVTLVHVDLFRLGAEDDEAIGAGVGLDAVGLDDLLAESELGGGASVLVVEWGKRWRSAPADRLEITLAPAGPERRDLVTSARGPRSTLLLAAWAEAAACS